MTVEPLDSRFVTREYGEGRSAHTARISNTAAPATMGIVRERFVPGGTRLWLRRGSAIILPHL
jgi:hypothetical protein